VLKEHASRKGWHIVETYADHGLSGAAMVRPGIQALMRDASEHRFDIVLAEALDRLSRDQEDTAHTYKRLTFFECRIHTLAEGDVDILHVGLKSTMNQLFLVDNRKKILRGQRGRVEQGKVAAGLAYGYDVVRKFDASGKPINGERTINESQARIVRRIFKEYAAGRSARGIAHMLNAEGVPSPANKQWHPSTIQGRRDRGIGILNCEHYIGRIVWNRTREEREPGTRRRVVKINPREDWVIGDAPELRILDQELWERAKARQNHHAVPREKFWTAQRPKLLLSGLIKCGVCGGSFTKRGKNRYRCATRHDRGTCSNRLAIHQDKLEGFITDALHNHLMDPALLAIYCEEYTKHANSLRMEANATITGYKAEMDKLERARKRCVAAIIDGVPGHVVKDEMIAIADRRTELGRLLSQSEEEPVLLHPRMADHYQREITNLITALGREDHRHEAMEHVRGLIEKVVLSPNETDDELVVDLYGDLAGILAVAESEAGQSAQSGGIRRLGGVSSKMVGPEGLEPPTKRL